MRPATTPPHTSAQVIPTDQSGGAGHFCPDRPSSDEGVEPLRGASWRLLHNVGEVVVGVASWFGEAIRIRERLRTPLDERLELRSQEPVGVLPGIPQGDDSEHGGFIV